MVFIIIKGKLNNNPKIYSENVFIIEYNWDK